MAKKTANVKAELLNVCLTKQTELVETLKENIQSVHEAAMDDKSGEEGAESFREQCQRDREMYTTQLNQATQGLSILQKINGEVVFDTAKLGSLVITDNLKVFLSWNIGKVELNKDTYFVISTQAPLFDAIAGKKKGETFDFRGEKHKVLEVY